MDFSLLGPVEAAQEGRPIPLGGPRQRALLARLLLDANRAVAVDRLTEDLWDSPPADSQAALQNQVSRLRKVLGDRVVTKPPGYLLRVEDGELDLATFRARLAEAGATSDSHQRSRLLREADAMFRGLPLADVDAPFAEPERAAIEELRLGAVEARIDADLERGRHAELVPELGVLVRAHVLRERLRGQLILALYRCGRQADALAAYREAKRTLDDELGLEPSEALRELELAILRQDPALDIGTRHGHDDAPAAETRRSWRTVTLLAAAVAAVVAAVTAAVVSGTAHTSSALHTVAHRPAATAALLASAPPSSWTTLRDDFSGRRLDLTMWGENVEGKGPSYALRDGRLELSLPANGQVGGRFHQISVGLFSDCRFSGDFDARVDYQLLDWPFKSGARAQLSAWIFPDKNSDAARSSADSGEQYDGDMPKTDNIVFTTDHAGTLRVVRRDGKMAAFFRENGRWSLLDSERALGQVTIGLTLFAASSDWADLAVRAAFDHFRLSAPAMQCG